MVQITNCDKLNFWPSWPFRPLKVNFDLFMISMAFVVNMDPFSGVRVAVLAGFGQIREEEEEDYSTNGQQRPWIS